MATNLINRGRVFNVAVAAGKLTGNPVVVGPYPGVCLTSRDSGGEADVEFDREIVVYDLAVEGVIAGGAPSAVAVGDVLYYDGTNTLNKNNAGEEFGVAFETVGAGATDTIHVALMSSG